VTYSHKFFKKSLTGKAFRKAHTRALQELEACAFKFHTLSWDHVFATSGTAKSLAKAVQLVGGEEGRVTLNDLKAVRALLIEKQDLSILMEVGINEARCAIFPGGLAIMIAVMESLNIESLRYSEAELAIGVLYEMDDHMRHDNIRVRTRKSIQARYQIDQEFAQHVADTCQRLWEQVAMQWGIAQPIWGELLQEAAHLHEVGLQISSSSLHRHSGYILQNSDLPGYNQEQQNILSILVAHHRKRLRPEQIPSLRTINQKKLIRLIRLLRVGLILNNSRQPIPLELFEVKVSGRCMKIKLDADYLQSRELLQADLEGESDSLKKMDCDLKIAS